MPSDAHLILASWCALLLPWALSFSNPFFQLSKPVVTKVFSPILLKVSSLCFVHIYNRDKRPSFCLYIPSTKKTAYTKKKGNFYFLWIRYLALFYHMAAKDCIHHYSMWQCTHFHQQLTEFFVAVPVSEVISRTRGHLSGDQAIHQN